jgi:hypothetical protein
MLWLVFVFVLEGLLLQKFLVRAKSSNVHLEFIGFGLDEALNLLNGYPVLYLGIKLNHLVILTKS